MADDRIPFRNAPWESYRDTLRPMDRASAFVRSQLYGGEPQLPQQDDAAGDTTLKAAGLFGAGMAPGAGAATAAGMFPRAEGGFEPSAAQDWRNGDYLSSALKWLGAAGDAVSATGVGAGIGGMMKAPLGMKLAMASIPKAPKAAKAGSKVSNVVDVAPQVESAGLGMLPPLEEILPGDYRISTRFPEAKTATENPLTHHLTIGRQEVVNSPTWERHQILLPEYAGFAKLRGMPESDMVDTYINQMRDNMNFIYENSPEIMRQRSPHWYEGANRISQALADRWGVPRRSVSGAIAALSPQLDWNINASLAERAGDALFGATASKRMTPEMESLIKNTAAFNTPANVKTMQAIMGKRLSDLTDPAEQAMWIRAYDEAHNPRAHRAILPEGEYGDYILNKDGSPKTAAWMSFINLSKALQSLQSGGDMDMISRLMGGAHKVRSFYNNIEVPHDIRYGDVTGDTHQMAAGHLMPYSGNSAAVSHNLGTGLEKAKQPPGYLGPSGSKVDGVQGTYGLLADATRLAGGDQGIIPRGMQSGTWEPVRELFEDTAKRGNLPATVEAIWRAHDAGDITADQARRKIFEVSGGIGMPAWAKSGAKIYDPQRGSTYR